MSAVVVVCFFCQLYPDTRLLDGGLIPYTSTKLLGHLMKFNEILKI